MTSWPPAATSQTSADGTTSLVVLGMPYDETDPRVDDALHQLRDDLVPAALDGAR